VASGKHLVRAFTMEGGGAAVFTGTSFLLRGQHFSFGYAACDVNVVSFRFILRAALVLSFVFSPVSSKYPREIV